MIPNAMNLGLSLHAPEPQEGSSKRTQSPTLLPQESLLGKGSTENQPHAPPQGKRLVCAPAGRIAVAKRVLSRPAGHSYAQSPREQTERETISSWGSLAYLGSSLGFGIMVN